MNGSELYLFSHISLAIVIIVAILTIFYYFSTVFNQHLNYFKTILFFLISFLGLLYCIESLNYPFTEYFFTDTHYFIVSLLNLGFLILTIYIYFKALDRILKMKKCVNCGKEIKEHYKHCKYCGRPIKNIQEPDMKISKDIQEEKEIEMYPEELDRLETKEEIITESKDEKTEQLKELLKYLYEKQEADKQKGEAKENDTLHQSL